MKPLAPSRIAGNSTVELALVLPLLLLLVIGVIDFGRAIHFNNVLVSLSREGGNLAARTSNTAHDIIAALNLTATPVDMRVNGMVYITTVVGQKDATGSVLARVRDQTRTKSPPDGKPTLTSRLAGFTCGSWTNGELCVVPSPGPVITLPMPLNDGEVVHIVETLYSYDPIAGSFSLSLFGIGAIPLMQTTTQLYSETIL